MTPRTRLGLIAPVVLFAAFASGCSTSTVSDKVNGAINDVANKAAASAVSQTVTESLKQAGVNLAEAPKCRSDLNTGSGSLKGKVNCTGTTTDDKAVKASFDGNLEPGNCSGSLVVTVGEEKIVDQSGAGCQIAGG